MELNPFEEDGDDDDIETLLLTNIGGLESPFIDDNLDIDVTAARSGDSIIMYQKNRHENSSRTQLKFGKDEATLFNPFDNDSDEEYSASDPIIDGTEVNAFIEENSDDDLAQLLSDSFENSQRPIMANSSPNHNACDSFQTKSTLKTENSDDVSKHGTSRIESSIYFIDFNYFKEMGRFPTYVEDETILHNNNQIDRSSSLVVFISHKWCTPSDPDDSKNTNHFLCVEGIEAVKRAFAPKMQNCYIWINTGCISPDIWAHNRPFNLDQIFKSVDVCFSPVLNMGHSDIPDYFTFRWEDYGGATWSEEPLAYMNQAWCRLDMFYSAYVPLGTEDVDRSRLSKLSGSLLSYAREGKRPHLLYGHPHLRASRLPTVLPPLHPSYLITHTPILGQFPHSEDKAIIETLMQGLQPYLSFIRLPDPDSCAAGDQLTGVGSIHLADGVTYVGRYSSGRPHGGGILRLQSGDTYEGK